jgi:ATP-grasp domain
VNRAALLRDVSAALGNRRLIWAGIRGDDAEPLADLPQLEGAYTIINAYSRRVSVDSKAYEDLTGVRVDLETWDIDDHLGAAETAVFRRVMLQALAVPSAMLPYRPSSFLSAIWFARRDRCLNMGLFGGHQAAFEHKPWVETSLTALGVRTIPWTYVADEEQLRTQDMLRRGPLILRRSRTSGGEGIVRVDDGAQLRAQWPRVAEAFVSVAPFLSGGLPVNVGATAWHDGVTVHYPSVQLIGVPECVTRPFGYCGNDFGLAKDLDRGVLDRIESATVTIGNWLRSYGYRGTFGVDFLVHDGVPLFTEINPRFQGSTHASCKLAIDAGQSCLMLEHLAAIIGMPAPRQRPVAELAAAAPALAHFVVHWTGEEAERLDAGSLVRRAMETGRVMRAEVQTRPELLTERGAAVARLICRESVTQTGFELSEPFAGVVSTWRNHAAAASMVTEIAGKGRPPQRAGQARAPGPLEGKF